MRVSRKTKIRIGKFIQFIDFLVCELEYRLMRLVYVLETPRVVRDAEHELHKATMLRDLDGEAGDWWDPADEDDYYFDGREWWLRDNDNPGDR